MLKKLIFSIILCLFVKTNPWAQNNDNNPNTTEELRIRSGLPNFFKKIKGNKKVTVAYLGGSITHQEGWRPKTFKWLQNQYPKTSFEMINAAVPGTGAEFGNCRLEKDLLSKNPDLVFVEFRVNGSGGFGVSAYEGLVRQIWSKNINTDICFVYTIGEGMIKSINKGLQHGEGKKLEKTAIHYNIPSIDFGIEVIKKLNSGEFIFRGDNVPGKKVFAKDKVHPKDDGHELYSKIVARSLLSMENIRTSKKHILPKPIEKNHFKDAVLLPITKATLSKKWVKVSVKNDENYNDDIFRTSQMLDTAMKSNLIGATIKVNWEGHTIGFSSIPLEENTEIELTIDDEEPKIFTFSMKKNENTKKRSKKFARFFYATAKSNGSHTAKLKITKLGKKSSFYCGQFLIFKTPIK